MIDNREPDAGRPFAEIGNRLRWHREMTGMQQKDYAATIGAKRAIYSMWETGSARLSLDAAMRLEDRYGLSLDFLYVGKDQALPMTLRLAWETRDLADGQRL